MYRSINILILILSTLPYYSNSKHLIKSIEVKEASMMTTDELGNVYLIAKDNSLVKYDRLGDSSGSFRSIINGTITSVDATNPLRILLYYANQNKILVLDRMLAPIIEINLRKIQIYTSTAVGVSADGKIWIFDPSDTKLKKVDEQLNVLLESNDLRLESGTVPNPTSLLEKNNKIYLCDEEKGIYTFDRLATYKDKLEVYGVKKIQIFEHFIVYIRNNNLISYSLKNFKENIIELPIDSTFLDARIERERLYLLFDHKLQIFLQE